MASKEEIEAKLKELFEKRGKINPMQFSKFCELNEEIAYWEKKLKESQEK